MVSAAQITAIQSHWNSAIKPHLHEMGNNLFLGFFGEHPEAKDHFKKFAKGADLATNAQFNAQTEAVMRYLDQVVANLGGNGGAMMKSKGADHKAYGVGKTDFQNMFNYLPTFMGQHGGDAGAWKAAGASLMKAMF